MARPEKGLSNWELRKLKEYNIDSWKDAEDAKKKMRAAMAENMKNKTSGGFAAIDAKAEDKPKEDAKSDKKPEPAAVPAKVEVLPATQTVDVNAPQINVHVPAPAVTVHGDEFKWYPAFKATFNWVQAAVIGAAFYAAFSSRLGDLITLTMK